MELLARASEYRDDDSGEHARRVGEESAKIASSLELGEEFVSSIRLAAPLHDVGKIGVPEAVLRKSERLSETEFGLIKQHPEIGHQILKDIPPLAPILPPFRGRLRLLRQVCEEQEQKP